MGGMHLDHFEAGRQCTLGRTDEGLNHLVNLRHAQFTGGGVLRVEGNFRRPHRYPATVFGFDAATLAKPGPMGAGLTPGMRQLNAGYRALGSYEPGNTLQWGDLCIVPQAKVLSGDPAFGGDRSRFSKDQPGTTDRAAPQMYKMPVIGQPIRGRILAHG